MKNMILGLMTDIKLFFLKRTLWIFVKILKKLNEELWLERKPEYEKKLRDSFIDAIGCQESPECQEYLTNQYFSFKRILNS